MKNYSSNSIINGLGAQRLVLSFNKLQKCTAAKKGYGVLQQFLGVHRVVPHCSVEAWRKRFAEYVYDQALDVKKYKKLKKCNPPGETVLTFPDENARFPSVPQVLALAWPHRMHHSEPRSKVVTATTPPFPPPSRPAAFIPGLTDARGRFSSRRLRNPWIRRNP